MTLTENAFFGQPQPILGTGAHTMEIKSSEKASCFSDAERTEKQPRGSSTTILFALLSAMAITR